MVVLFSGTRRYLVSMSEKQGLLMDKPESAAAIPKFLKAFEGEINVDEIKLPLSEFKVRSLALGTRLMSCTLKPRLKIQDGCIFVLRSLCDVLGTGSESGRAQKWGGACAY